MTWKWDVGHILSLGAFLGGMGAATYDRVVAAGGMSITSAIALAIGGVSGLVMFLRNPPLTLEQALTEGEQAAEEGAKK